MKFVLVVGGNGSGQPWDQGGGQETGMRTLLDTHEVPCAQQTKTMGRVTVIPGILSTPRKPWGAAVLLRPAGVCCDYCSWSA